MPKINGSTKICGIIGDPISHSISPQMHNAAFEKLGLNFCYIPLPVKADEIKAALEGIKASGFVGINVTIPYKESVIPYLDEVTEEAKLIGAVNTVHNRNGKLIGYNTDGQGFLESLKSELKSDPKGKRVVLLGAGGGARAVAVALSRAGISSLIVTDKIAEKAKALAKHIRSNFKLEVFDHPSDCPGLKKEIERADILINATPVGMFPKVAESPIGEETKFSKNSIVCDLVYNPPETKLLKMGKAQGAQALNGLPMLVRQGALAFSIFTGLEAPLDDMKRAAEEAL